VNQGANGEHAAEPSRSPMLCLCQRFRFRKRCPHLQATTPPPTEKGPKRGTWWRLRARTTPPEGRSDQPPPPFVTTLTVKLGPEMTPLAGIPLVEPPIDTILMPAVAASVPAPVVFRPGLVMPAPNTAPEPAVVVPAAVVARAPIVVVKLLAVVPTLAV